MGCTQHGSHELAFVPYSVNLGRVKWNVRLVCIFLTLKVSNSFTQLLCMWTLYPDSPSIGGFSVLMKHLCCHPPWLVPNNRNTSWSVTSPLPWSRYSKSPWWTEPFMRVCCVLSPLYTLNLEQPDLIAVLCWFMLPFYKQCILMCYDHIGVGI